MEKLVIISNGNAQDKDVLEFKRKEREFRQKVKEEQERFARAQERKLAEKPLTTRIKIDLKIAA